MSLKSIKIHMQSQSRPIEYTAVRNAYTKDGMYCVLQEDGTVQKFPCVNIFRVTEVCE